MVTNLVKCSNVPNNTTRFGHITTLSKFVTMLVIYSIYNIIYIIRIPSIYYGLYQIIEA